MYDPGKKSMVCLIRGPDNTISVSLIFYLNLTYVDNALSPK